MDRPVGHSFHITLMVDRARLLDETPVLVQADLPQSITIDPNVARFTAGDLPPDGRFVWTLRGTKAGASGTGGAYRAAYVDGQGHFRDSARLLLAELFLDVIAGELARRSVDRTHEKGDPEAYEQAKHTFVRRYGLEIHRILMGR